MNYRSFSNENKNTAVKYVGYKLNTTYLSNNVPFELVPFLKAAYRDLSTMKDKDGTLKMTAEKAFTFTKQFPQILLFLAPDEQYTSLLQDSFVEIANLTKELKNENSAQVLLKTLGLDKTGQERVDEAKRSKAAQAAQKKVEQKLKKALLDYLTKDLANSRLLEKRYSMKGSARALSAVLPFNIQQIFNELYSTLIEAKFSLDNTEIIVRPLLVAVIDREFHGTEYSVSVAKQIMVTVVKSEEFEELISKLNLSTSFEEKLKEASQIQEHTEKSKENKRKRFKIRGKRSANERFVGSYNDKGLTSSKKSKEINTEYDLANLAVDQARIQEDLKSLKDERAEDSMTLDELSALIPDIHPINLDQFFGINSLNKVDTNTSESTNYLKLHRREGKRGLNQITYGIDYIPMYRDTPHSKKISSDRKFIYDFKNGNYTTEHIRVLEKLLLPDFYVDLGSNLKFDKQCVILPIPASTKSKQQNRYNKFLIEFCQNKKNLINGFELVQILFDRQAKHISETRESMVNYKIDLKSISKLGNVDIIVFDDLVTQGSTISQFLNELGDHKDKVKQIITLGATV